MDKYNKIDFGDGQNTNTGDTLYDAFSKVNNAFNEIENDINVVDDKLNDFIDRVEVDINELDNLINDLENNKADKSELNSEVNRLDNDINNLTNELTNTNNNIIDLTNDVDDKLDLKADKSFLDSEIIRIDNDIIDLTNDVDDKLDLKADKSFLDSEILRLDNSIIDLTNDVDNKLDLKADKSELNSEVLRIDNSIIDLTNDVDNKLDLKADKSESYTKVEIDNIIENVEVDLSGYATIDYVDSAISNINFPETDLSEYYNKSEINLRLDDKADKLTTYTKVEIDDLIANNSGGEVDLTDYYTKTEVDTKTVFGENIEANGTNSVALGNGVKANGISSVAIGRNITSYAFGGITIGQYNDPILTSTQTSFNAEHPLFIIGNGISNSNKSNAFVMLQNGKSQFTNIASYKEDYSGGFTENSLVNKKYVDDLVANNSGGGGSDLSNYYTKSEVDTKVVFGSGTSAQDEGNVFGNNTTVEYYGNAFGNNTTTQIFGNAFGDFANAGNDGISIGTYSKSSTSGIAIGNFATSNAYGGIVIGQFNDPIVSTEQTTFDPNHPLFIIANGQNPSDTNNAFVMLQNGRSIFTNIAGYKSDFSADFTDSSLVNKKYVDDLVTSSSSGGGNVGELVTLSSSSTVDINWNNDIVICDSSDDFEILVPSDLGNLSFVVRNIGEGNVTITTDGTSFHSSSSGQVIENGQITSVIITGNIIITTGTL